MRVIANARDVVFTTQDSYGNNSMLRFKKDTNGDFKLDTGRSAYSNFNIPVRQFELEWLADEGEWNKVMKLINFSYERIIEVQSR